MSAAPDIHALARQVAVLKERMNTMDERYDKGWALLREDMAKRETRMLVTVGGMIGLAVAVLGAGFAFLGVLIGLPG